MPRDAVSRTANVGTWLRKRNGGQKWVKEWRSPLLQQEGNPKRVKDSSISARLFEAGESVVGRFWEVDLKIASQFNKDC